MGKSLFHDEEYFRGNPCTKTLRILEIIQTLLGVFISRVYFPGKRSGVTIVGRKNVSSGLR